MNNTQLPHNDPDLTLAKKIGECRDNHENLNTISDNLPDYLLAYKKSKEDAEDQITVPQDRIWSAIENEISANKKSAKILSLHSFRGRFLRIAAAILLAALLSLFYFTRTQTPNLIAEAGNSITEVSLTDGSNITLRPHSTLWKLSETDSRQEYRLKGEGYFTIANNPDREFSVAASDGRVTVLGTRFVLSDWGSQTRVFLEEGSVQFEVIETGEKADLKPGEKAVIGSDKKLSLPEPANQDIFTSWMNNRLQFSDRPARLIFDELEFHFQIRIQAPETIEQESLGGSVTLDEKEQALRDLGIVLGGTFETTDGTTYKFVPESR
jgi:transmembrane sensor